MTPPALGVWAASCGEWDVITPPSLGYVLINKTVQEMTARPSSINLAMAPLPQTQHVSHTLASLVIQTARASRRPSGSPCSMIVTNLVPHHPPTLSRVSSSSFSPQTQCHLLGEDFPHCYLPKLVSISSHIQLFNLC